MTEIKTAGTPARLRRRAANTGDEPWLRQFFALLRGLDPALIALCPALLEQQWQLQQCAFASHYPGARTDLILLEGDPIGLVTLHEGATAIRILELGLDPRHRGQGLGERLLAEIIREADARDQAVELAVMRHNPALRLYQRLGFLVLPGDEDAVQLQMRRPAHHAD